MHVGDEIFFFSEERLKAKGTEITSPKEKADRNKHDSKFNYDETSKRSPVASNNKRQVSTCESKERSLDCPSTKLSGLKCNSRQKSTEKATKEGSKSLVKIQVENCYKESSLCKPESPEEIAPKPKRSDYNCRGSLSDGDCGVINKSSVKSKKSNEDPPAPAANSNAKKPPSSDAGKNKFTWCGSCKSSKTPGSMGQGSKTAAAATAAVVAAHERQTKGHLKRLSRSSLSTDSANIDSSGNNKISLNLSKYSPCASRLAASSKILSSDSLGCGPGASGGVSPESPLHVSRSKSPVQPSLSLKIQKPAEQPTPSRSKSVSDSCVTSPISDATSSSPPGTEVISLEDVSQNREERWSCNHRSPR